MAATFKNTPLLLFLSVLLIITFLFTCPCTGSRLPDYHIPRPVGGMADPARPPGGGLGAPRCC
nr:hypothetical protein Iba_chr07bCG14350 [Ipomoea batatas]GMD20482.1 hypothetical protein Iba_scaffold69582CG0010 [Ipomoea batatas]